MTGLRSALARIVAGNAVEIDGAPAADITVAPESTEQLGRLLAFASEHGLVVLPWGAGTHQGFGARVNPDIVVSTARFGGVREWEPDDLTAVVGAATTLEELDLVLADRRQSAVLPERIPTATTGGVVAAGVSGWRRLRYGPTRDRVLQVEVVTGDGRVVIGGGAVVKNVTGYDLPKLFTGSFGSLGVIVTARFKLWPVPQQQATVRIDDAERAFAVAHRPQAMLETGDGVTVYLGGTPAEVAAQAAAIGGVVEEGFDWPEPPNGDCVLSVRVPLADTRAAVARLPAGADFVAAHGVGEVRVATGPADIPDLRAWAESRGGAAVIERAPAQVYEMVDPWGTPPESLDLQRAVVSAFDPGGVMVPGRLPGGV